MPDIQYRLAHLRDPGRQTCLHTQFESRVVQFPTALALCHQDACLTYLGLNQAANRVAHILRAWGVGPGSLVAVCIERSTDLVVAILGTLKAGAGYVPLDPLYPHERLAFMLHNAQPAALVTRARLERSLPEQTVPVLRLDRDLAVLAEAPDRNPNLPATADQLAYVIYTSGSTGQPKGVCVPHRGVSNLLADFDHRQVSGAGQAWSMWTSASFDVSVYEIFGALTSGGTLHLPPEEVRAEPAAFSAWLAARRIHSAYLPPFMVRDFAAWLHQPGHTSHLRRLLVGVEPIPDQVLKDIGAAIPGLTIINGYGPTETSICATALTLDDAPARTGNTPIGTAVHNTSTHVLDRSGHPVPSGQAGELFLGGTGVAWGYLYQPGLTAERFVPDPFSARPGARLYRTGDLVRELEDGQLEFLGRADHQVKIRGFRVEPGEIESVLRRQPEVLEAVVVAHERQPGDRRLVAYVVPDPTPAGQDSEKPASPRAGLVGDLRRYLADRLPSHMVPALFVVLPGLPVSPNGKLDRQALPAPDWQRPEVDTVYAPPATPTQVAVAATWCRVLGLARVGIHDDFFALGGHSLAVIQVMAQLRAETGIELPITALFDQPTVAALAATIDTRGPQGSAAWPNSAVATVDALETIQPAPRTGPLPLAVPQEQVWLLQQLYPDTRQYHFQATLRLRGQLDVAALAWSLQEIVHRHEIFRTTFPAPNGRPEQVIHEAWPVTLAPVDLRHLSPAERSAAVEAWLHQEFQRPFALDQLPLVRWTLLRLGPDEHILVHVEHHLVHDGWSFNLFLRELTTLYRAAVGGLPSPLPALSLQFADYAAWQQRWVHGTEAQAQLAYWRAQLHGGPGLLELPTDRPRPATPSFRGAAPRVELPLELCDALRAFSQREGVTLFMTMLTAFLIVLHRYTGQTDLVVGSGVANRRRREVEEVIGMLINMAVLRADLAGHPSVRALMQRVRACTLGAYENQELPFEKVVEALHPERNPSHNPIFQVAFSFHDSPMAELVWPGVQVELVEGLSNESAKFDLNVVAIPRREQRLGQRQDHAPAGITLAWEYSTDLFTASTIERMLGHYQRVLRAMVGDPEQAIDDLDLLDDAERQQVVSDWNATGAAWVSQCVHKQFEAQVTRRPEALALVMGDERLTYAALDARANRLGWYLRARGVGPEVRVAVCLARSPALVVAELAILKAGGAYVPLDPAYPTERLRTMIADAGAIVVLSQPEVLDRHPDLQRLAVPVLDLTTIQSELYRFAAENITSGVTLHNLAYVIYTSGSTGKPKGVAVEHGSLANLVGWHLASFGVTAADRATQMAGPGFDAAVWEIWPYLAAGAGIEIVPEETRLSARALRDWLVAQGSTIAFVPTPVAESLIGLTWPSPCVLRWLLTGGDRLHAYPAADLPFTLVNNYGPTENTVVATSGVVVANLASSETGAADSTATAASASAPSIGRAISNVRSYVLDGRGAPVPVGIPGELWLGGSGVARGYLGDPAQTADRFRPDPFGPAPGGRLYRTGDLVRWRAAGDLEFLGRVDDQVKVRGFRIELGEITAALQQHSGVQQAFVAAPRDEQGRPYLAAYVVPQDGQLGDASGLRDFLAARLPDHMLPAAWTFLDALPMTPNGKVDRKALPQPAQPASPGTALVPPRTALEETVATHWAAVLGLDQVGVFDNFFALGGHSLLAAELVARLRDACHVALPLRALFDAPTVAGLAAKLDEVAGEHTQSASPAVPSSMISRAALLAQLDELSDDEVDALLAELEAEGEEWDD